MFIISSECMNIKKLSVLFLVVHSVSFMFHDHPQTSYSGYWVPFPGINRLGGGVDHPPKFSTEIIVVVLYLCFPSGPALSFLG